MRRTAFAEGPRLRRLGRALPLLLALLAAGCGREDAPVALDTAGGDAWSFDKLIEGSVRKGACDAVTLASTRGMVVAEPHDGRFAARVPLLPGDNEVEVRCRKGGVGRGAAERQHWLVRIEDRPKAWIRLRATEAGIALDGGASERGEARPAPIARYEWRGRDGNPAPLAGLPASGKRLLLRAPALDGEYEITLRVTDALGRADESTAMFRVRGGRAVIADPMRDHPAWVEKAVLYGVVPSLFGRHGLADVTARLDRLAALGVSVLWLAPVAAAPPGDFGYAVSDPFRLRADLGGEAALRALVRAAHAKGLRVILDVAANHLSDRSAYFADAAAHGARSPYFAYFARDERGGATHYFDWRNLENLDYDDPEVQRMTIAAFAHWLRDFDVDGFRVDAAWGPRERAPEFWPRWRRELKRIKPDLLLLAEGSARDPYYRAHGFDAAYDWTGRLGEWAWQDAFADAARTAPLLRASLAAEAAGGTPALRFLDNNDTGARFVTRYGLARTRLAAAMLLTLPGLPALYTGDEVGAEFEPYAGGPPLGWQDSHGLRAWYARLIALRREIPALTAPGLRLLDLAPADRVLAYLRPGATPQESVLVLLNYGSAPARMSLPAPLLARLGGGDALVDRLSGERLRRDGDAISLTVGGNQPRILEAAAACPVCGRGGAALARR
jgi:glycosidase